MNLNKNTRRLNYLLFFLVFLLQIIDNYDRENNIDIPLISSIKNIALLTILIILLCEMVIARKRKKLKYIFVDELKSILKLVFIFAVFSLYYIFKNNNFEIITLIGLIRMIIPVIVGFFIINVMDLDDIYDLMSKLLILMFIGYLFSIASDISIENIKSINLTLSTSPFESNFFSPAAMGFSLFFCYFRKNKFYTYLSVFFTIMTFKRIMVLYSIFLLLFGGLVSKWKKIPKWVIKVFLVAFCVLSIVYIQLMLGNIDDFIYKYTGIYLATFTMGRSYFIQVLARNFTSLGFMSSIAFYKSIEMDLPMIYIEMGILPVFATIYIFTKIAKDNWYNFLIIIFCLLEMLTSHWLDITYFWIVFYITIGCIQYKETSNYNYRKNHIKFVLSK